LIADTARAAELAAYDRASARLLSLIRGEKSATRTPLGRRRRAEAKLARSAVLLQALGDPHRAYPVVHVTGTSGKGSTCTMIAAILTAAGFRVGLRTSPYLQVATEKLQIGSSLIDALSFDCLSERVLDRAAVLFPSEVPGNCFGYAEAWTGAAASTPPTSSSPP
jgi:dihydrofolate synthase/folylpolyglutamate synthase